MQLRIGIWARTCGGRTGTGVSQVFRCGAWCRAPALLTACSSPPRASSGVGVSGGGGAPQTTPPPPRGYITARCQEASSSRFAAKTPAFCSGRNEKGQLGHGDTKRVEAPKLIEVLGGEAIVLAACGRNHTLALTGMRGAGRKTPHVWAKLPEISPFCPVSPVFLFLFFFAS